MEITQHGLRQVQVQPKIGVEASLTGHLVLSTLHTNSAPDTIIRLLDMGIDPLNFADALTASVKTTTKHNFLF
jgi:type II secretory ATPase GspE/PulE/Tfp pilus assembly ATPase PilB-like protein